MHCGTAIVECRYDIGAAGAQHRAGPRLVSEAPASNCPF